MGLHEVDQYEAASNVWVAKAPLDVQRFSFGAAYLDEGVYVIGGNHYCANATDESCHATAYVPVAEHDEHRLLHSSVLPELQVRWQLAGLSCLQVPWVGCWPDPACCMQPEYYLCPRLAACHYLPLA